MRRMRPSGLLRKISFWYATGADFRWSVIGNSKVKIRARNLICGGKPQRGGNFDRSPRHRIGIFENQPLQFTGLKRADSVDAERVVQWSGVVGQKHRPAFA